MGRSRDYRHKVIFSSSIEANLLEEFEDLAADLRIPRNELVQRAIKLMLEGKKQEGQDTPIAIAYRDLHQEPLDRYLQEGFYTRDQWREKLKQEDNLEKLTKYEALGLTISQASNARIQNIRRFNHP